MLKFNSAWRFESPGAMPSKVVNELSELIGRITTQGKTQEILERFKSYFASAAGTTSTWSSSASWAQTDMDNYMQQAADNAPLFLEAFYDACESLRSDDLAVPDVKMINRVLAKFKTGYEIRPPELVSLDGDAGPVEAPAQPASLDAQAREIIQKSLSQSEQFLSDGNSRQAVQEVLWLLETVSTAFQGIDTGTGTVQGKYFNKIVADLRRRNQGTTLDQVLDWVTTLHGYLSSPTGGGIRHGTHLKAGVATKPHEARLFCNLIRSYIFFLIAEHERLTGHQQVLD
jgi:hypothetical protein